MEPIISVSGLRGIVGETLTPLVAARYLAAFSAELPPGKMVVARDGRPSGRMLADVARGIFAAAGRDVIDLDVAATPTVGVLVRELQAVGGVQISASHNPPPYNGLKLFQADGRVLPAQVGERVLAKYRANDPLTWVGGDRVGQVELRPEYIQPHLEKLLSLVNVKQIQTHGFRVLLDANHGSGAVLARPLLEALGCTVEVLGAEPHGRFAHPPEPTAENLHSIAGHMQDRPLDIAFCQDPDADRLAIIDENGRYVGEEYTLALCVDHILRHTPGPVVTNCATSRMTADLAQRYHVPCILSAVGEANVADAMIASYAVFGGEGNGGPIDPRVGLVRDSFVGMTLILAAMAMRMQPVSALVDELPRYEIRKTSFALPREKLPDALDRLEKKFNQAQPNRQDGLRLDWPDRWLIVRASNTEPIVRAIAEAPLAEEAEELCAAAKVVMTQ